MHATFLVAAILRLLDADGASMDGRTILGDILDARVSTCGIVVEDGAMARIRPFIETSADVTGVLAVEVIKRSSSGTSATSQSNVVQRRKSQGNVVMVDSPSVVTVKMNATAVDGTTLCRLAQDLKFGDETTGL